MLKQLFRRILRHNFFCILATFSFIKELCLIYFTLNSIRVNGLHTTITNSLKQYQFRYYMKINIYMLAVILTPLGSHHSKYFNVSLSKQTNKTINNHNIVTSKLLFSCTVKTSFTIRGNVKVVLKVDKKKSQDFARKKTISGEKHTGETATFNIFKGTDHSESGGGASVSSLT